MGELLSYKFTNVVYFKPLPVNMVENAPYGNPKYGLGISSNLDLSTLKMEAECFSEITVPTYKATRC
jgi:hypothetical protein